MTFLSSAPAVPVPRSRARRKIRNRSVALIESGPDYLRHSRTPFDLVNSHNNSYRDHDWGLTYNRRAAAALAFPRGRSSADRAR
jgi:hypothetical protein